MYSLKFSRTTKGPAGRVVLTALCLAAATLLQAQNQPRVTPIPNANPAAPPPVQRAIPNAPLIGAEVLSNRTTVTPTQTQPSPSQDPLMTLMLSQPKLEVSGPVMASAQFDPPIVRPGSQATYRIGLNALEDTILWPDKLKAPAELNVRPAGRGQVLQMTGTNMIPRTSFNYRVRPNKNGSYTIPEFVVTVNGQKVTIPAATLHVRPDPPPNAGAGQILVLDLPGTNYYVGQPIPIAIQLPAQPGGVIQGLTQVKIEGEGLIMDPTSAHQRVETAVVGGVVTPAYIYEVTVTPLLTGNLPIFAQGYTVGNRFGSSVILSGGGSTIYSYLQYTLVDSDPTQINVKPLPPTGRLPGFTGAVGAFRLEPPMISSRELRVGEPVKMAVRIRGSDGLARLVPPEPPKVKDWQVFSDTGSNPLPPQVLQAQGFTMFHFSMIPMREGVQTTPPIPFSYFNPESRTYVDLTIPGIEVTVSAGKTPVDLEVLAKADQKTSEGEKEPVLSDLSAGIGMTAGSLVPMQQQSWFPMVQMAPAGLFLALWGWDRRRRYLEQHPDVVLRRQARRALRRERRRIRRAVGERNVPEFMAAAVSALRVACAPYYPAEPRALVSADVLAVLPEADRTGHHGQVVRNIFAEHDAMRFASANADAASVLALNRDLEQVLARLEEKL